MVNPISMVATVDWRRVANVVCLFLLVAVVGLFVAASVPGLVGADESYVVLSDSMSPTIKAGAVVFVSDVPTESIQRGDVVTFRRGGESAAPVTHRVVGFQKDGDERAFLTKGDANDGTDPSPVPASTVVGTVIFHVPLIGYVVSFANTGLGVLALVVVPAILLVVLELRDFWRAMETDENASEEDGTR